MSNQFPSLSRLVAARRDAERLLAGLDDIDWAHLRHAYGLADDVPGQIRALLSPLRSLRQNALWKLYGNIFHQGTRYEASAFAVPFLLRLAAAPETPERHEIIGLLVDLALGYPEQFSFVGVDRDALLADDAAPDAQTARAAYAAVEAGADVFVHGLDDADVNVRMQSAYAAAWFPAVAEAAGPRVRAAVDRETDPLALANAILSLGYLARAGTGEGVEPIPETLLDSSRPPVIRCAAAISLAQAGNGDPSGVVLDTLVGALDDAEVLEEVGQALPWHGGDLVGYAGIALHEVGRSERGRVIPALCRALAAVGPIGSLTVTEVLLGLLFGDGPLPSMSRLDPLQQRGLEAVAAHGAWCVSGGLFVNYCNVVQSFGLPGDPGAFRKLLEGAF